VPYGSFSFIFRAPFLSHGKRGTVVFSDFLGWLMLSAPQGGMPELLAPCSEESTFTWKLCVRKLFYWDHNQGLPFFPWFPEVAGSLEG
jgi:hypothetical protein